MARGVLAVACLALAVAAPARAQPEGAQAVYERAVADYGAGRYAEAVAGFDRAYQLAGDPILLYNIAQAHRRRGDVQAALVFYQRYLEHAADGPALPARREEASRHLEELRRSLVLESARVAAPPSGRLRLSFSAAAGVSRLQVSLSRRGPSWQQPVLPALDLQVRRPVGNRHLEAGLSYGLAPVAYWERGQGGRGRATINELTALASATAGGRWRGLVEVGLGVQLWSGLGEGNPLTGAREPLAVLPQARLALGAACDLGARLSLRLRAGFGWAPAAGSRFARTARDVRRSEVLLGIGYTLD